MMEESAHAQLMVPDILMPVQYYDGMRRDNPENASRQAADVRGASRRSALLPDLRRCPEPGRAPDVRRDQQFGGMNPRRLGRRANVRSEGQISSPQRRQPRRRKGDIGRSNAVGNPSPVAHACRRGQLEGDTAPIEIYRDDPAMPSITPDSASPLTREHEQEECGVQ